jgi:cytochrome c-type biogenesis protein CcmH/NrfF
VQQVTSNVHRAGIHHFELSESIVLVERTTSLFTDAIVSCNQRTGSCVLLCCSEIHRRFDVAQCFPAIRCRYCRDQSVNSSGFPSAVDVRQKTSHGVSRSTASSSSEIRHRLVIHWSFVVNISCSYPQVD